MLDQAFEALKTYDWGTETKVLDPIEEAVVTTRDDATARQDLETRLVATLKADVPRAAKDYVCRKLRVVGTAASVPALAELLSQEENSHMARYALESMPVSEAAQALRDALGQVSGELKVGMISSLGVREDAASVPLLAPLLEDDEKSVARAAALALGAIRTPSAAKRMQAAKPKNKAISAAIADASLACAEGLLDVGKKAEARRLYKSLSGDDQPKHVRLAATRGLLACAGK